MKTTARTIRKNQKKKNLLESNLEGFKCLFETVP
ncbi:hypothetical protein IHE45_04G155800 [Dioscorea alata]|uniref:Uncharacterized protein n=1 Tax=Dioscorea alata TaxID=55571 RepID=A0ACB7WHR2_DIOAL|nr:hypothetical protein IHE45_04G155800 [Dioscorea alata]